MRSATTPLSVATRSDLTRLARGCWSPNHLVDELAARCVLLLASSADDSLIVSPTAAQLHELWLPALPDEIHLATATPQRAGRSMTRTRRPEVRAHRRQIPAEDRAVVDGVLTLTRARAWRDLAALLSLPDLVAAGDCALRDGTQFDQLSDAVSRTSRLAGVRRARLALGLLDKRSRSRPESHLRVAVSGPEMPAFQVNEAVHRNAGGWLAEPDLSLAEAKLALEYQGDEHAKLRRMRNDITRFEDMRREGWLVIPYGPAQVFGRPHEIRPEVRELVRERAPQVLPKRLRSRVVT